MIRSRLPVKNATTMAVLSSDNTLDYLSADMSVYIKGGSVRVLMFIMIMGTSVLACPLPAKNTAKCPKTEVKNRSNTWTSDDAQLLKDSKLHCQQQYPGTPCLTVFIKFADGSYQRTCSAREE